MTDFSGKPDVTSAGNNGTPDRPKAHVAQSIGDAAAAFLAFVLLTAAFSSGPASANPYIVKAPFSAELTLMQPALATAEAIAVVSIAAGPRAGVGFQRGTGETTAWGLLSLTFSLLMALNIALLRHLRQAYAHPRLVKKS